MISEEDLVEIEQRWLESDGFDAAYYLTDMIYTIRLLRAGSSPEWFALAKRGEDHAAARFKAETESNRLRELLKLADKLAKAYAGVDGPGGCFEEVGECTDAYIEARGEDFGK